MTLTSFWFSVFRCSKKHLVNCCFGARCFGIRMYSSPHERDCTFLGDIEKRLSFKSRNPKATVLHGWILWPQDCLFSSSKRKCGSQRLWHCGKFHLTFPIRFLYTIVWMFSSVFLVHGRVCNNTIVRCLRSSASIVLLSICTPRIDAPSKTKIDSSIRILRIY